MASIFAVILILLSTAIVHSYHHVYNIRQNGPQSTNLKKLQLNRKILHRKICMTSSSFVWRLNIPADDVVRAIDKLPASVRPNTMSSNDIEDDEQINIYKRVTVSDICALTGRDIATARSNLVLLSRLTQGNLQVTNDGDIVYLFPTNINIENKLRNQYFQYKVKDSISVLAESLMYVYRISFGLALMTSILIIFTSLIVISTAGESSSSDSDRKSSHSGNAQLRSTLNLSRFFLDWYGSNPYHLLTSSNRVHDSYSEVYGYSYRPGRNNEVTIDEGSAQWLYAKFQENNVKVLYKRYSFLESVYSYLFGDENPNAGKIILSYLVHQSCE